MYSWSAYVPYIRTSLQLLLFMSANLSACLFRMLAELLKVCSKVLLVQYDIYIYTVTVGDAKGVCVCLYLNIYKVYV